MNKATQHSRDYEVFKKAKDRDGVQRTDLTPEGTIKYINMHLQYLFPENSPISGDEGVDGLERKTENLLEVVVTIRIVITPLCLKKDVQFLSTKRNFQSFLPTTKNKKVLVANKDLPCNKNAENLREQFSQFKNDNINLINKSEDCSLLIQLKPRNI